MKIIQASVIKIDNFVVIGCDPVTKDINCEGATVLGMAWMVPLYNMGVIYDYQRSLEATKPSLDSIRVIMVRTGDPEVHEYYITVADDATPATFTDLCNACCGDTPSAPAFTMPAPIAEVCICANADGNYVWPFPLPHNPNALAIKITAYSFNGAYGTPAPPASFANAGALQTWLAANWAAYGTWSQASGVETLTSETVSCMNLAFDLVAATYCMPFPVVDSITVDTIVMQTSATGPTTYAAALPGGPVTYSNTETSGLLYVLSQILVGTLTVNAGPTNKLQYTGLQKPVKFQFEGSDVGDAFSVGACVNSYAFPIPANPGADNYHIASGTFNGVAGTPAPVGAGHATTAALLIWLNANWSAYGTWTIVGSDFVLTSSTTYSADLVIDLV